MKVPRPCWKQRLSTLASVKGFEVPIHKRGKRITKGEATEVLALLDRRKSKSAVARETGISRSKVYQLWNEKLARDADEQAIQQREEEDRKKPCLQHVFIMESVTEDSPSKTVATSMTRKIVEVKRCRLCGFEERRSRFFQIN